MKQSKSCLILTDKSKCQRVLQWNTNKPPRRLTHILYSDWLVSGKPSEFGPTRSVQEFEQVDQDLSGYVPLYYYEEIEKELK